MLRLVLPILESFLSSLSMSKSEIILDMGTRKTMAAKSQGALSPAFLKSAKQLRIKKWDIVNNHKDALLKLIDQLT